LILDPFGGSGTTAEVCLRTKRQFITMELEPNNFEKIKVRLEDFNKSFSHETPFETEW
jgi:DNA modification methylase